MTAWTNDCDGVVDEGLTATFWQDADGDGFGDPATPLEACEAPTGHVANADDCDDADAARFPDKEERCNEVDNDCDGDVDEDVCGFGYGGHRVDKGGVYYYALYNDVGFGAIGTGSWYGTTDVATGPESVTWNEDQTALYYSDLRGHVYVQTEPFGASSTLVGTFPLFQIGGGVVYDGYYYVGDYTSGDIYAMDVTTGAVSLYASLGGSACKPYYGNNAMSIDVDGKIYASSSCGVVVYEPGVSAVQLNLYTNLIHAVAMDARQELYSLDEAGNIVHLDKATGATLSTVAIPNVPYVTWTLAIDERDQLLVNYWGEQRIFDLATGALVSTWSASGYYPGTTGYYWYVTW